MSKNPVLAYEPEGVLDAWYNYATRPDKRIGDVVGQMIPGGKFTWEVIKNRPSLSRIDGIGIIETSQTEYNDVLKAIAQGQFQITETDRTGQKTILHKATGFPLKPPAPARDLDDTPSP